MCQKMGKKTHFCIIFLSSLHHNKCFPKALSKNKINSSFGCVLMTFKEIFTLCLSFWYYLTFSRRYGFPKRGICSEKLLSYLKALPDRQVVKWLCEKSSFLNSGISQFSKPRSKTSKMWLWDTFSFLRLTKSQRLSLGRLHRLL